MWIKYFLTIYRCYVCTNTIYRWMIPGFKSHVCPHGYVPREKAMVWAVKDRSSGE